MKKFITLSIIACTLASNTSSLGMFRVVGSQKQHLYKRMHHTKRHIGSLPPKTIFNASEDEISTNAPVLLEDLYDRNNKLAKHLFEEAKNVQIIINLLEDQNNIAINHTYHDQPLNLVQLKSIELDLQERLKEKFQKNVTIHSLTLENKVRGHADE